MDPHNSADAVLESCRQGDPEAFRVLFETYRERVFSIALVFFHGDTSIAGDVTQQVFLKLMTRVAQFESRADFSTWLHRLVTNTCLDKHRRQRRWVLFGSAAKAETIGPAAPARSSVEEEYSQREMSLAVQRAIGELRPKFRITILLKYFDDLSYEEMSVVLQVSKGTVASRLNRGHRMLAKKLAHLGYAQGAEV